MECSCYHLQAVGHGLAQNRNILYHNFTYNKFAAKIQYIFDTYKSLCYKSPSERRFLYVFQPLEHRTMAVYPLLERRFLIVYAILVVFCIPLRKNGYKRIYITLMRWALSVRKNEDYRFRYSAFILSISNFYITNRCYLFCIGCE